jgi:hypothetical protein
VESKLFDCVRGQPIEPFTCGHHQDVGVVCVEGEVVG